MGSDNNSEIALVTGGARRIGKEIALHLHRRGFDIVLHYRSSSEDAEALARLMCDRRPDSCMTLQADIQHTEEIERLGNALAERYDRLNLLVNNASGYAPTPIDHCTPSQFDDMLNANLRGPYFLVQALLPLLKNARGSIVNILDVHAERPLPGYNAYCAAKSGLTSLTRSLAVELAPQVRVNGVSPGAILWPEEGASYDTLMREDTLARTPLQRQGDPADIAGAVGFLACDAPFVTGQVLTVDGGRSLVG